MALFWSWLVNLISSDYQQLCLRLDWGPRVYDFVPEPTTNNHLFHDSMEYEEPEIVNLKSGMDVEQILYTYFIFHATEVLDNKWRKGKCS